MNDEFAVKRTSNVRFPVAGITACDNCWDELEEFFAQITAQSDVIYIVNTPDSVPQLLKHLTAATNLPVAIHTDFDLQPNTIYVLPEHKRQDIFFADLAVQYTDFAIGVCLYDPDKFTTVGFTALKNNGGITFSSEVAYALPDTLLDVTDFISHVRHIPKQLKLLSSRFEKEKLLREMHDILEDKVALRTSEINIQKEALVKEKEFSEKVINATIDFMVVYDRDLRFLAFNNSFKKIYGLTDSDLGKRLFDVFPEAQNSPGHRDVLRAIEGEAIHSEVYQSPITFDYYELYYIPFQIGESVLIVGHDIGERINSEKSLEDLNSQLQLQNKIFGHAEENALMGSYYWNLKSGEMKYSDNLFRIMGYEPDAFVPSFEAFLNTIHPDDKEEAIRNGTLTVEQQKLFASTYRILKPDGQIIYCRSTGNFIGEDDGLSLIGTVQDISADVKLNETLTKQNIELQNSNEDLASFNYIASHDLQEPLRKIHMFSSRILERDRNSFSPKSLEFFERIESAISRMQNLIQALLNYSSSNPADLRVENTDLNAILNEVMLSLEESISEKKAVIEAEQLPAIEIIPLQFQQLLSNLVSNAIKYSRPEVNPKIIITSERVILQDRDNNAFYKIAVNDNGIGFEQQYAHKIFDLFQRLHGKTDFEGTGVGLAICKKIVQNHNGFITAEGTPGQGSTFTIYIPAKN